MKNRKVKVFHTIESLDRQMAANDFRASGYMTLEVADQIIGGRALHSFLKSQRLNLVEVVDGQGQREDVLKCADVKRIALEMI